MKKVEILGWSIFSLALCTIVLLANFSVLPTFLYDEKRIFQALLLVSTSLLFVGFIFKYKVAGVGNTIVLLSAGLLFLLCLSSIRAPLPQWAFLQAGWYVLLVQFTFIGAYLYRQNKQRYIKWVIGALFLLAGIYVAHVLANTFSGFLQEGWPAWPNTANLSIMVDGEQIIPQGFLGFSNKRFLNHLQTWSLPLLVLGVLYYKDKLIPGLRYIMLGIISGWWMLVFASDARGTVVASAVSLIVIGYLYRGKAKEFIVTTLGVAAIGLAAYYLLFLLPGQGAQEIAIRTDSSGRIAAWIYTLKLIAAHPFFGLGPMHYSHISVGVNQAHPHNFMLQTIAEWGIPAVILLAVLSFKGYFKFIKIKINHSIKKYFPVQVALVASLTAGIAHSMVSGIFNTPLSQLMACIILGWAVGHYFEHSKKQLFTQRKKISWPVWVVGFFLIVNTIFVAQKVAGDVSTLDKRNEHYIEQQREQENGKIHLSPRFWQQGKIGVE